VTATMQLSTEQRRVDLIFAQLDAMPALSPAALKILSLGRDGCSNADRLSEFVTDDPRLSERLLSVSGRPARPIILRQAVEAIGFHAAYHRTLGAAVMLACTPGWEVRLGELDRYEFWLHSLATACAARRIAQALERQANGPAIDPEEAFVLGLTHDVGRVALAALMPKSYARVLRRSSGDSADVIDVERAVLGLDHAVAGRRLATRWRLPRRFAECAWLHHLPPDSLPPAVAAGRHVQIVQLANVLTKEQSIGLCCGRPSPAASHELSQRLGLGDETHIGIAEAIEHDLETNAAWLSSERPASPEARFREAASADLRLAEATAALRERDRRLERKARYLAAIKEFNAAVPQASIHDLCAVGAEVLAEVLAVQAVVVFVPGEDGASMNVGWFDGLRHAAVEQRPACAEDLGPDIQPLWSNAGSIALPGREFEDVVDRFRPILGAGPIWLLPISARRSAQHLRDDPAEKHAAALFAADQDRLACIRAESEEIPALCAVIGTAIDRARQWASAGLLAEEIAEAGRRAVSAQKNGIPIKTMDIVAAMAAGAAHEMNNPLSVISGRAQLMRRHLQGSQADRSGDIGPAAADPMIEALDEIVRQSAACSRVVSELLEAAEGSPGNLEPVRLTELLAPLAAELESEGLLDGDCLSLELPRHLPDVWFDRGRLSRIFRELVTNSVEASDPDGPRLAVKIEAVLTEDSMVVRLTDNGRGMTAEVLDRALDPFFSHRPAGRGRGLGLFSVRRWLQLAGGDIRIRSRPAAGTTIEMRIPTAPEPG